MPVLVSGRLVQGLGGGGLTVALYVVIARVYPPVLHPKIFAAFSAAWVIPSLVGPFAAGAVAELAGWQWVFLGVVGLVIPALLLTAPALRGLNGRRGAAGGPPADVETAPGGRRPGGLAKLALAALAALAVLGLNLSAAVPGAGAVLAAAAVAVALLAVRPLMPRGTLTARRGLPSVILTRGLASAAFFGAEVYLPYLLVERYAFPPTLAGLTLTGGAIAWAAASAIQGKLGTRLEHRRAVRIGSALVLGAVVLALVTTVLAWPAAVVIAGWIFAGGGMGLMYPRLSVMTLALSTKDTEGFNSSAMSISDSLGGALALAGTGIVFAAFATAAPSASFAGVFALTAVIGIAAVAVAPRVAVVPATVRTNV
jgi:MFS family permease